MFTILKKFTKNIRDCGTNMQHAFLLLKRQALNEMIINIAPAMKLNTTELLERTVVGKNNFKR